MIRPAVLLAQFFHPRRSHHIGELRNIEHKDFGFRKCSGVTDMSPQAPQGALGEPGPVLHFRSLGCCQRWAKNLGIFDCAFDKQIRGDGLITRLEQRLPRCQIGKLTGSKTNCSNRLFFHDVYPPHHWASDKQTPEHVCAQLQQQPIRKISQGINLILSQRMLNRHPILCLTLHPHRNGLVHPGLHEKRVQLAELLSLALMHHAKLHHGCGQDGDDRSTEYQAAHQQEHIHDALCGAPR
mmetsp:Transcript_25394/g.65312  ORF Transcript_25394/g.65312 Transcript_25394/m.65312 type:complete len:239 (-) Transcript_25394:275-991(-)